MVPGIAGCGPAGAERGDALGMARTNRQVQAVSSLRDSALVRRTIENFQTMPMNKLLNLMLTVGLTLPVGLTVGAAPRPEGSTSVAPCALARPVLNPPEVVSKLLESSTRVSADALYAFELGLLDTLDFSDGRFREGDTVRMEFSFTVGEDRRTSVVSVDERSGDAVLDSLIMQRVFDAPAWTVSEAKRSPGLARQQKNRLKLKWLLSRDAEGRLRGEDVQSYGRAEQMPRFEGGGALQLRSWLRRRIDYAGKAATLSLRFTVEKDGSVSGIRVTGKAPQALIREVESALEQMPHLTPGSWLGSPVRVNLGDEVIFGSVEDPTEAELRRSEQRLAERMAATDPATRDSLDRTALHHPQFRSGNLNTFRRWVMGQVRYPQEMLRAGRSGEVIVSFVVKRDGSVDRIKVVSSPHKAFTNAVVGALKRSPHWSSGTCQGWLVPVPYTLPVRFTRP